MKIVIPYHVHEKIMHWVDKCDFEVSGMGKVSYIPDSKEFFVHDVYLMKQEGGAAHTEIDAQAMANLMGKLFKQPGNLSFWWHSHVNMAAFMSGTDKDTIRELGGNGWCVAAVFNKKWEYQTAIGYKYSTDFGETMTMYQEGLDMDIRTPSIAEDMRKSWDAEYTENVKEKKYVSAYQGEFGMTSEFGWQQKSMEHDRGRSLLTGPTRDLDDDDHELGNIVDLTGDVSWWLKEEFAYKSEVNMEDFDRFAKILTVKDPELVEEARLMGMKPKRYIQYLRNLNATQLDEHLEVLDLKWSKEYGTHWAPTR